MSRASTARNMTAHEPRSVPETGSGNVRGEIPDIASDGKIRAHIDTFYALAREAVELWGGPIALASLLDTAMSTVSERLNRREVKGALQRAFQDYPAIATTHPGAAERYLFGLCDLFGYEHPKKKRTKTEGEKLAGLVKALRGCGPLGDAAIKRAAADLGADPSEYDL